MYRQSRSRLFRSYPSQLTPAWEDGALHPDAHAGGGAAPSRKAFIPLRFAPGEAFQFDWSCKYAVIAGLRCRLEVAHIKLAHSRAFLVVAYPMQTHEMLFDAHARGFTAFGGVPRRGIYDNMKTAVDKVGRGKERTVNARFQAMSGHYLFEPEFCNRAAGWEKGIVEKNVQDRRRQLWAHANVRHWSSLDALNDWLASECWGAWADMRHPEYPDLTLLLPAQSLQRACGAGTPGDQLAGVPLGTGPSG